MTNENHNSLRIIRGVQFAMVAAMFIAGAILYARLPDVIPTHWGFDGKPNGWSPKSFGVWLIPGLSLFFMILFPILQRLDPKSQNYENFQKPWAIIQTSILGYLAYIYAVTMFVTFEPAYNAMVGRFVIFGMGILFVVLGNYLGKVRQNYFVGLRTPWTLDDPEVWQKSQRLAGWAFVLCGLVAIIESLIWIAVPYIFFSAVVLTVVVPIAYSYVLAKEKKKIAAAK